MEGGQGRKSNGRTAQAGVSRVCGSRQASLRCPGREFSHRIQIHQGLKRPNLSLHSPLFSRSETPLRHSPRSSPSCHPRCSVRGSTRSSDRCGLDRSLRCSPGCCPGLGSSCCLRCSLRCFTRCSTGRSDRCGPSCCPRCSPRSSDGCSTDCSVNCRWSCCPSCSVHCCPDCSDSNVPRQVIEDVVKPPNPLSSTGVVPAGAGFATRRTDRRPQA